MALSAIGQIALPVSDTDRSEAFYGQTLGLSKLFRFGEIAFFDCAGVRLMLEGSAKTAPAASGVCFYFKVGGIDAVYEELKSKAVVFEDMPHMVARMPDHELWMCFFRDPDGHLLALMEERR